MDYDYDIRVCNAFGYVFSSSLLRSCRRVSFSRNVVYLQPYISSHPYIFQSTVRLTLSDAPKGGFEGMIEFTKTETNCHPRPLEQSFLPQQTISFRLQLARSVFPSHFCNIGIDSTKQVNSTHRLLYNSSNFRQHISRNDANSRTGLLAFRGWHSQLAIASRPDHPFPCSSVCPGRLSS